MVPTGKVIRAKKDAVIMAPVHLVYCSGLVAGWCAWAGWLVAEMLFFRSAAQPGTFQAGLLGGILGGLIGLGLGLLAGLANAQGKRLLLRAAMGLAGGCLGGIAGGITGDLLSTCGLPRGIGWLIAGLGIGASNGLYERSMTKTRNGLLGGAVGGLLGGLVFDPIQGLIATESGAAGRAVACVVLGVCTGTFIALAQVLLQRRGKSPETVAAAPAQSAGQVRTVPPPPRHPKSS
jgi:hypothetical protein